MNSRRQRVAERGTSNAGLGDHYDCNRLERRRQAAAPCSNNAKRPHPMPLRAIVDPGEVPGRRLASRSRIRLDLVHGAARLDFESGPLSTLLGATWLDADATGRNERLQDATTLPTQRLLKPTRGTEPRIGEANSGAIPATELSDTLARRRRDNNTHRGDIRFAGRTWGRGTNANTDNPASVLVTPTLYATSTLAPLSRSPVRFVFREQVRLNRHIKARN